MPVATIHKMGQGDLYMIHFLERTDPGFGGGVGGGADPGYDRPSGGRPDNSLPGSGGRPDNTLPGQGRPGIPSNELPDTPPPQVAPGTTLILIREGQSGKWHYATLQPGSPPPKPLPPGSIEHPGNRPPGSGVDHPSGQPVPPTAQPQRR